MLTQQTVLKPQAKKLETITRAYKKLLPLQQRLLQLKALLYNSNKPDFYNCVLPILPIMAKQKKLHFKDLTAILNELVKERWLDNNHNCQRTVLHLLTDLALDSQNPDRESNLQIIQSYLGFKDKPNLAANASITSADLRAVHMAVHTNNIAFFNYLSSDESYYQGMFELLRRVFLDDGVDIEWLQGKKPAIQLYFAIAKLLFVVDEKTPSDIQPWLVFYSSCSDPALSGYLSYFKAQLDIRFGLFEQIKKQLVWQSGSSPYAAAAEGNLQFFAKQWEAAGKSYDNVLKGLRKIKNKRQWFMDDIHGMLFVMLQIQQKQLAEALACVQQVLTPQSLPNRAFQALEILAFTEMPGRYEMALQKLDDLWQSIKRNGQNAGYFGTALLYLAQYVLKSETINDYRGPIEQQFNLTKTWHPLAAHLNAEILLAMQPDYPAALAYLKQSSFSPFRFLELFPLKAPWEFKLQSLSALISNPAQIPKIAVDQKPRLVWLLDPKAMSLSVLEQSINKNGSWSKGRAVALRRLFENDSKFDYLSAQDLDVIKGIERDKYGWYGHESFEWNMNVAIPALIDHPLVFLQSNPAVHIELIRGEIELFIEEREQEYVFSLSKTPEKSGMFLDQESPTRYRVLEISQKTFDISRLITKEGLKIPKAAKEAVLQIIQSPDTQIKLSVDLNEDNLPTLAGNPSPCLHLLPLKEGLKLSLWVCPFGETAQGHYYRSGEGKETVIAVIKTDDIEQRTKAVRSFKQERAERKQLISTCPTLEQTYEGENEWHLDSTELCLEVLNELEQYKNEHPQFRLEWPKGQSFQLKKNLTSKDVRLSITSNQQWFEYDAEITIDDGRVVQLQTLLGLLNNSHGRFVEIEQGQFIGLTSQFKKQLQELQAMSEGNRVYHLSANILKELAEQLDDVSFDAGWQNHVTKLEAMAAHTPAIPNTLQATLRDYQVEGFHYLSRLAHWGIGACLADDMGLGKTVQAIAFLLEQATKGPSLVIAPTSVCFNWCDEIAKFAPTLRVYTLSAQNRADTIKSLGEFDVLVSSYGLLVQEETAFLEKAWQVVILDEAQAIKNSSTQRWKTATSLNGSCRLALTGTPIENHLGELWSIFRFLNPGLLSSLKNFQQRYALPIEKYQDEVSRRALKKCVQPYILRRLKSAVLAELPPKTEQTILIEPTVEERAFYEAVRKQALERIASADNQQQKRFTILAEILKLRQACCDSALIQGNLKLESSKVKTFLALVSSLRENQHKALVFSQFVRYLTIIREHLDRENISYQYIDGETPPKKRQQAVSDFQAGSSDLFLLSLKAGGTGLNLTAADYVIHLDPWWNPAVEDQASDRAHRIGQLRPVTIYRLIMQDSIEQKIINLHAQKRDLASDLLSGSDFSGKLSEEELIRMMVEL